MAYSRITAVYSGTNLFSINFTLGYLDRSHVTARVNNEVDGSGDPVYRTITWITNGTVSISGALVTDDVIVFDRNTPKDVVVNDYANGQILDESNLDSSYLQCIMIAHEVLDGKIAVNGAVVDLEDVELYALQAAASASGASISASAAATHALTASDFADAAAASAALLPQNNFTAIVAPGATDDAGAGYAVGSRWVDVSADESYICVDATVSAAVWLNSTLTIDELGALSVLDDVSTLIASQVEAEAGTENTKPMSALRVKQAIDALNPSYIKAFVNFNGTGTVAIRNQFNVASITDLGTGNYRVVFDTALPDANYSVVASREATQGLISVTNLTTAGFDIQCKTTGGSFEDSAVVCAQVLKV